MHLDIFVEDHSGKEALEILVPKIINKKHTFTIRCYGGLGQIPKKQKNPDKTKSSMLLNDLPRLVRGFGKTYAGLSKYYSAAIVIVCDLDSRCKKEFRLQIQELINNCSPRPRTQLCIAIEEGEAWLLGDKWAVLRAYPNTDKHKLNRYENDSICNTWEYLADCVYEGGSIKLCKLPYQIIGRVKTEWAKRISQNMDVDNNISPSFCYFRDRLRELTEGSESNNES